MEPIRRERLLTWPCMQLVRKKFPHPEKPPVHIPPEILEMFLKLISDHNTLLHCRLVCFEWKTVTDDLLEKRRLSNWSAWESKLNQRVSCLTPSVWAIPQDIYSVNAAHIVLPSVAKSKLKGNPFPQKSVAIVGFDDSHLNEKRTCPKLKHKSRAKLLEYFKLTGHLLTSLTCHDLTFTQIDLEVLLTALKNLKALTLSKVQLHRIPAASISSSVVSPHLIHLKLIKCHPMVTRVVLFYCSHQIVTLKIGLEGYFTVENETFENLKHLAVYDDYGIDLVGLMLFTEMPPPLQYFSGITSRPNTFKYYVEDIFDFIPKISISLVYLRLEVKVNAFLKLLHEFRVVFPNVISFEIVLLEDTRFDEESLKDILLHWFPKLEILKFIGDQERHEAIRWYQDRECLNCENFLSHKGHVVGHVSKGNKRFYSPCLPFTRL